MRNDPFESGLHHLRNPWASHFFELIREPVILIDPEGVVLDCNPAAIVLFGYAKDEMIGMTGAELAADPNAWHRERGNIIKELAEVGNWKIEFLLRTKGGRRFWGSVSMTAFHDEHGKYIGNISLFRDETDLIETRKARDLQNSVFSQMSEGVVILDRTGRNFYSNAAAEQIFQKSIPYRRNENLIEVVARAAGWPEEATPIMEKLIAGQTWASSEGVRFDFQPDKIVSLSFAPVKDVEGNLSSILMMLHDITVLSEALEQVRDREASLKQTQRIARCGSWIYRWATEEVWCSQEAYEVMGYPPDENFDLSTWCEFFTETTGVD